MRNQILIIIFLLGSKNIFGQAKVKINTTKSDTTAILLFQLGENYFKQYQESLSWEGGYDREAEDRALDYLKKSIVLDSNNYKPYFYLGLIYSPDYLENHQGDIRYDSAIYYFNKSLVLKANEIEFINTKLGLIYFSRYQKHINENKESFKSIDFNFANFYYKRVLKLNPNNWEALDNLAHHYYQKYEFDHSSNTLDTSIYYYEKSLSINSKNYQTLYELGKIFYAKNIPENAAEYWVKSIKINMETDALYYLLFVYQTLKDYKGAIAFYESILPKTPQPNLVNVYNQLSEIYRLSGDSANTMKYKNLYDKYSLK